MATVDTFLADLRGYIQHQDEQPLLGPNFYRGLLAGELSRQQLKNGRSISFMSPASISGLLVGFL